MSALFIPLILLLRWLVLSKSARGLACFFIIFSIAGCGGSAPTSETIEIIPSLEATEEAEEILVPTATMTPEPPTPTSPPTITNTPVPTVEYTKEVVGFTTEDGFYLDGRLFLSQGDTAVVFAHMAGENDQQNWIPYAEYIARRGFTALTFDFRCYGESECGGSGSSSVLLSQDLGAAINFLRKQGIERIVCIGASMGGRGCVNVAFDQKLAGLVIVAGTGSSDPDRQNLEDALNPDMPKLFIVSENDHVTDRTLVLTRLYESAPDPKTLKIYSGSAHGTELFDSQHGQSLRNLILEFLFNIPQP